MSFFIILFSFSFIFPLLSGSSLNHAKNLPSHWIPREIQQASSHYPVNSNTKLDKYQEYPVPLKSVKETVSPILDDRVDSYLPQHTHNSIDHLNVHGHGYGYSHDLMSESTKEENIFAKTVAATKLLKLGKFLFTFFMLLVVLGLAIAGHLGVSSSPAALPVLLLPIGFIFLILFVPLFLLYLPIVAREQSAGAHNVHRRRKQRSVHLTTPRHLDIAELARILSMLDAQQDMHILKGRIEKSE